MHDYCGNEIFMYCAENQKGRSPYAALLNEPAGFKALPRETFIRRIPFYFFTNSSEEDSTAEKKENEADKDDLKGGTLIHLYASLNDRLVSGKVDIESIYEGLEFLYYQMNIPLRKIFNYPISQGSNIRDNFFFEWIEYINLMYALSKDLHEGPSYSLDDSVLYPERFITAYNHALQRAGRPPIIYPVHMHADGTYYKREGSTLVFTGLFPTNEDGSPILEWTNLTINNPANVTCTCTKSRKGELIVELSPATSISVTESTGTTRIYSSPLNISFSPQALKARRKELKLTQEEVANATQINLRTFQKYEQGTTEPTATALLRLISWLDLQDISSLIIYK